MLTNQNTSVPYDPDFDEPRTFAQLSPLVLFVAGVITAALVLCTIGFFILLKILFV